MELPKKPKGLGLDEQNVKSVEDQIEKAKWNINYHAREWNIATIQLKSLETYLETIKKTDNGTVSSKDK